MNTPTPPEQMSCYPPPAFDLPFSPVMEADPSDLT